jgi:rhamnogalacturonyl hydrolase YesR
MMNLFSKKNILLLFFAFCFSSEIKAQTNDKAMAKLIDENFALATSQYKLLIKNTPADLMPRNYIAAEKKLVTSNAAWWTSGFFPASLWYIYEFTKDTVILAEAERRSWVIQSQKFSTNDHDLGFKLYCSFGNAYRITDNKAYRQIFLTAAKSLTMRYRPSIHSIQSWDSSANFKCPVIIDNMMNLELLCKASEELKDPKYKVIAVEHANTTIKNHYRPDYSSYHVIDYDIATGEILKKKTAQGFSNESAWARGQVWGLYGFTMMYRFTKDEAYLDQAKNITKFLLNHPNLPKDKIAYWDFNAPNIPNTFRDVSAASIMASALLELAQYTNGKQKNEYLKTATTILKNLSTDKYRNRPDENGGFILKHSVGSLPGNSEVDVPLTYADYYFLEALLRYKNWYLPAVKK